MKTTAALKASFLRDKMDNVDNYADIHSLCEDVIEANANKMFCIVLATDGVWDNWAYEDVTRFVMDSSCVQAVMQAPDGAQRVAQSFMQRNAVYARRNFGGQADNATGIVGYFSTSHVFAPSVST